MKSIRIPPGGSATLEVTIGEDGKVEHRVVGQDIGQHATTLQDPLGGPALVVSDKLKPDPMAIYLLGTAIIEATRALDEHTQAIDRNREAADRSAAAQEASLKRLERRDRLWRPIAFGIATIGLLVMLADLTLWVMTHVRVN
jgi:hypothetical protein